MFRPHRGVFASFGTLATPLLLALVLSPCVALADESVPPFDELPDIESTEAFAPEIISFDADVFDTEMPDAESPDALDNAPVNDAEAAENAAAQEQFEADPSSETLHQTMEAPAPV